MIGLALHGKRPFNGRVMIVSIREFFGIIVPLRCGSTAEF